MVPEGHAICASPPPPGSTSSRLSTCRTAHMAPGCGGPADLAAQRRPPRSVMRGCAGQRGLGRWRWQWGAAYPARARLRSVPDTLDGQRSGHLDPLRAAAGFDRAPAQLARQVLAPSGSPMLRGRRSCSAGRSAAARGRSRHRPRAPACSLGQRAHPPSSPPPPKSTDWRCLHFGRHGQGRRGIATRRPSGASSPSPLKIYERQGPSRETAQRRRGGAP